MSHTTRLLAPVGVVAIPSPIVLAPVAFCQPATVVLAPALTIARTNRPTAPVGIVAIGAAKISSPLLFAYVQEERYAIGLSATIGLGLATGTAQAIRI